MVLTLAVAEVVQWLWVQRAYAAYEVPALLVE